MATIIHRNEWSWGRKDTIVIEDGRALCQLSVENDAPDVAWLSDVIVYGPVRRRGYGNRLLEEAKTRALLMGASVLKLWVDPVSWMYAWYMRKGFVHEYASDDGFAAMTMDLL